MDGECAFCGRAGAASSQVFCEDHQAPHEVCELCANEAASAARGYLWVA